MDLSEKTLFQKTPLSGWLVEDVIANKLQQTLVIRIVAIILASDRSIAIPIPAVRPSKLKVEPPKPRW